jgi:hypothetical protein
MQILNGSRPGRDELPTTPSDSTELAECPTSRPSSAILNDLRRGRAKAKRRQPARPWPRESPEAVHLHLEFELSRALRIRFVEPHPEAKQADV